MFNEFFTSPKWETARMFLTMLIILTFAVLIAFNFDDIMKMLGTVFGVLKPFIAGSAVAYVLNLLMTRWEKIYFPDSHSAWVTKTRRPVSLILSILIIGLVIFAIAYFVSTELMTALVAIGKGFMDLVELANNFIDRNSYLYSMIGGDPEELTAYVTKTLESFGGAEGITSSVFKAAGTFVSGTLDVIIAIVFAIYALVDKENVLAGLRNFGRFILPPKAYHSVSNVLSVANGCFSRFVYGQCLEAFILGMLCSIGLEVLGFEYAVPVGLIVGAMSIIPILGAWIGGAIGAVMMFSVSPQDAVLFLIFLLILQQLESNLIYPKVVGTSVGVPGIWVLSSVFIGGALFNVVGILFAVPIVATCRTLIQQRRARLDAAEAEISEDSYMVNMREVSRENRES